MHKFVCTALGILLAVPVLAADYDLVINGGRVMDPETRDVTPGIPPKGGN